MLGAIVSSALTPEPAYAAPAYQPVYQQPAQYQYQQTYAGPPPGTCYDGYRNAYVACGPQPAPTTIRNRDGEQAPRAALAAATAARGIQLGRI
ncbi:hypothetical protein B7760_02089 [Burkholderia glumae]|nr:hypothetical protein B7760_02089 [Burkholderia glumae]